MLKYIIITCVLGAIAVLLGAFGSHSLKELLTSEQLDSFMIAVRYHAYYVILLLIINTYNRFSEKQKSILSQVFIAGILLFSGSIYLIQLTPVSAKSIWFVTPLGGLFFVLGWVLLGVFFYKALRIKDLTK